MPALAPEISKKADPDPAVSVLESTVPEPLSHSALRPAGSAVLPETAELAGVTRRPLPLGAKSARETLYQRSGVELEMDCSTARIVSSDGSRAAVSRMVLLEATSVPVKELSILYRVGISEVTLN